MRKLLRYFGLFCLAIALFIFFCNLYINGKSARYLYDDVDKLPENEYGLVLGTSKYLVAGGVNDFFAGRTQAAANLYRAGKVQKLIVSGFVDSPYYDEPAQIQKELLRLGVPDSVILADTAGYRTINSVLNQLNQPWGERFTIITQKFHNQRAVFLARQAGIDAIGFNVPDQQSGKVLKPYVREFFAKVLAFGEAFRLRSKKCNPPD